MKEPVYVSLRRIGEDSEFRRLATILFDMVNNDCCITDSQQTVLAELISDSVELPEELLSNMKQKGFAPLLAELRKRALPIAAWLNTCH